MPSTVFPQKSSFADVLAGSQPNAPREEIYKEMVATRKGEFLSVTLDTTLVKRGVEELQNSLIVRLILAKGEEPYSLEDLARKLEATWNIYGGWKLVPIGRGYYNVQLPNLEDIDRIMGRSSWSMKPGVVWVQRWVRDFNPYKTDTSIAQVWVQLFEIPMEYFQAPIIHALASPLGTVLKIDDRTKDRSMCHYARVLIELDMKQNFEEYIMFEMEGHYLFASVKYESLPPFCKGCGIVAHNLGDCRMLKPMFRGPEAKAPPRV
ncbi:hypothetical protein ACS0TY_022282 [Phlomoides rotata]